MSKLTSENITSEILISYVDGELSAKEKVVVEELIRNHPDIQDRVNQHRELSIGLGSLFNEALEETPDYIATKIHALADKKELQENIPNPLSNVVSFVRRQFIPSWDNFSGLTKVAAGVVLGIIATPYLFNQQPDIVTVVSSNISELKSFPIDNQMTQLKENQEVDSIVIQEQSKTVSSKILNNICIDKNGFGISTHYEGKTTSKNDCDPPQSPPTIIEGVPFKMSVVAPVSGKMTITKFLGTQANAIVSDIDVLFGKTYTTPQDIFIKATNQDKLIYEISFSGSGIKYSRTLNFKVSINKSEIVKDPGIPQGAKITCKKVGSILSCE